MCRITGFRCTTACSPSSLNSFGVLLMKTIVVLTVVLSTRVTLAGAPLAIDFSSGKPADYFTRDTAGRVRVSSVDGAKTMVIADATARLSDVTVKPGTKYTLSVTAAFEGDVGSMEENPRFEIFNRLGQTSSRLPSRRIEFLDAAGKSTGRPLVHAMPWRGRRTYQDVFYTPANAAIARIGLSSGKGVRLALSRLGIEKTADEGALNVNPAFRLGPDNYSGWRNIAAGGRLVQRDGKTVLDTKYGSTGQTIPLSMPGTYALDIMLHSHASSTASSTKRDVGTESGIRMGKYGTKKMRSSGCTQPSRSTSRSDRELIGARCVFPAGGFARKGAAGGVRKRLLQRRC